MQMQMLCVVVWRSGCEGLPHARVCVYTSTHVFVWFCVCVCVCGYVLMHTLTCTHTHTYLSICSPHTNAHTHHTTLPL